MSRLRLTLPALILPVLAACADTSTSTAPRIDPSLASSPSLSSGSGGGGTRTQRVDLRDDCDSVSFNAVLGPGGCVRRGSITFDEFIAELTKKRIVGAWKNNPLQFGDKAGTVIDAQNIGGEAHTFTRVASFGGGVVPLLNQLSGNTKVAPECAALDPTTIVPAGGHLVGAPLTVGTHRFQCCFHPWMRTTATIKRS